MGLPATNHHCILLADRKRQGGNIGRLVVVCLALTAVACASASQGINARLASVQADIDQALADDQLDRAYGLAVEFEYRLPGGDSFAALGDVLWRRGEFIEAEALHRRAVEAGVPRGYLGLARADLARARWAEAEDGARRAAELPEIAPQAMSLLASVEWARGRPHAAAEALAVAADAETSVVPQEAAIIAALESYAEAPAGERRSPLEWRGETATLELSADAVVEARIGGLPATLRIVLDGTRSSIAPQLAARISGGIGAAEGDALGAPLTLGTLRTSSAVFRVRSQEGPQDGTLGFDLLSTLGWAIDLRSGAIVLWAAPDRDMAGPLLARTHWATVRIPRRGLEAQLLVLPRFRAEVVRTSLDLVGRTRIGSRVLTEEYAGEAPAGVAEGDTLDLELRIGGWRGEVVVEVADLTPLAAGGRVAPQAILGADVLVDWRIWWRPDFPDLRFERHPESAPAPDLPLQ